MKKDEEKILEVLNNLNQYINFEGGHIEFIKYEDKTVFIKLLGACAHCAFQYDTINESILKSLQEVVPEIESVINVEI